MHDDLRKADCSAQNPFPTTDCSSAGQSHQNGTCSGKLAASREHRPNGDQEPSTRLHHGQHADPAEQSRETSVCSAQRGRGALKGGSHSRYWPVLKQLGSRPKKTAAALQIRFATRGSFSDFPIRHCDAMCGRVLTYLWHAPRRRLAFVAQNAVLRGGSF